MEGRPSAWPGGRHPNRETAAQPLAASRKPAKTGGNCGTDREVGLHSRERLQQTGEPA